MSMLSKVKELLKSCLRFWKSFILNPNKKTFLKDHQSEFKSQVIVLLSTALISFVFYSSMKPAVKGACRVILRSDESQFEVGMGRVTGVEAMKAKRGTTLREIKSIGTLKANAEVVIKSEIAGKISEILFTEGSEVRKGDTLIKFEDDLYRAEKAKYEAEYSLNKGEYDRVNSLYNKNVGSKKTYDEAFARMQASKAQLDSANAQLNRTIIKAPFDGVIGILRGPASPGNIVQQQTELVYIVDNSTVRVEFSVPAKYIDDVAVGQNVEITVDAFKDRVFTGTVDAIDSEIDTRNHSVLVRAVIPNKNKNLKHGMFANVKLITGEKNDVILIDEDALLREGSIEYVWVIDDKGRAYRKRVLSGAKDINGVEILAGLRDGEIVVTTGQLKLTEGGKTKILNKDDIEEAEKITAETNQSDDIVDASTSDDDVSIKDDKPTEDAPQNTDDEAKGESATKAAGSESVKSGSILDKVKKLFKGAADSEQPKSDGASDADVVSPQDQTAVDEQKLQSEKSGESVSDENDNASEIDPVETDETSKSETNSLQDPDETANADGSPSTKTDDVSEKSGDAQ